MRKADTKVCPIDVQLLRTRDVDVLASGAVDLDSRGGQLLTHSDGQHVLSLAQNSRTITKGAKHVLLFHHGEAPGRDDEPRVDEPVEVHGRLIDLQEAKINAISFRLFLLLIFEVLLIGTFRAQYHVHALTTLNCHQFVYHTCNIALFLLAHAD